MIDTQNTVVRQTARELGLQEDLVKRIYEFYWEKGVKDAMRSGEHLAIRVSKFGTFMVSKRKLYTRISKYIAYIRHLKLESTKSFSGKNKEEIIEKYIKDLKILLARRNELAILYNQNKINNENHKLSKTNMGE